MQTKPISIDEIERVYSGINGKCMCGCFGKYSEADEAGRRSVKIILNKINKALAEGREDERNSQYVAVVNGDRILVAYFKETPAVPAAKPTPAADFQI